MIYMRNITITTAKSATYLENVGWNILPEEQHFILGGRLKGKPLPEDREIFTVHYRTQRVLRDAGLYDTAKRMLKSKVGVRYVRRLVPDDAQG